MMNGHEAIVGETAMHYWKYWSERSFHKPVIDPVDYLKRTNWILLPLDDTTKLRLVKEENDMKLELTLYPQFSVLNRANRDEEEDMYYCPSYLESKPDYEDFNEFFITIKKNGKDMTMLAYMTELNKRLTINKLFFTEQPELYINSKFEVFNNSEYKGPEFPTLQEHLQLHFIQYLNSLGIDNEFGMFVKEMCGRQEMEMHNRWLRDQYEFFKESINR